MNQFTDQEPNTTHRERVSITFCTPGSRRRSASAIATTSLSRLVVARDRVARS